MSEVRLIDANTLREQIDNYNYFYSSFEKMTVAEFLTIVHEFIDNAPTVDEIPQGDWVRKEDIINYIATQYSKHNELVPVWLNIGDLKGGAE